MWLWKIFFPVTISLFGCNHGSEFIVPSNDGKTRYFRGFETDEFHFKIKNDATNAKNVSYIYLLDNLDARTNYGRYMRISVRYDLHGTTWLNIYSCNSGLTASERTAKFRDKPDKDGFRGYWIRRQRPVYGRLNRWEFGQEWDNVHPIMRLKLKFPFFPQFFALEGFSTWKLEQILFGRPSSSFGFFSSADLSMVNMPTFFPPVAKMMGSQPDAPNSAAHDSTMRQILKLSDQETSTTSSKITIESSIIDRPPTSINLSTHLKGFRPISKKPSSSLHQKSIYLKRRRVKTPTDLRLQSNSSGIEIKLPNVTFPKIDIPSVTLPSIKIPKITLPSITFPKIKIPPVTMPSIDLPKFTLPNITFPKINIIPSATKSSVELPKITLPSVTFPKIDIKSLAVPIVKLPELTLPSAAFSEKGIPVVTLSNFALPITFSDDTYVTAVMPSVTLTRFDIPKVTFSNISIHTADIPSTILTSIDIPTITSSNFTFPTEDIPSTTLPNVDFPETTFSNITFPQVNKSSSSSSSIELPKITSPNVTLPKINIPSGTLPSVEVPKITWPKIPSLNMTFPELENPVMTLLPMIQSNVTSSSC